VRTGLLGPSQRSLRARSLRLRDRRLDRASLFPFFDGDGRVRAVMVTDDQTGRISIVSGRTGLFIWRALGANRLSVRSSDLCDVESPDDWVLEELWHFDPWWELGAARYASHPAGPPLSRTNLAGYAGAPTSIWFDSAVGRVTWVASGSGDTWSLRRFSPALLKRARIERRERPSVPADEPEPAPGWRLNPFWENRTGPGDDRRRGHRATSWPRIRGRWDRADGAL